MTERLASPAACSVIVATRDRPGLVSELVRSILSGSVVPSEIVVVDGSTTPTTGLAARHRGCDVRVVRVPPRGLSASRNRGILEAQNEALVFVDDDMIATADWLASFVAALEESDRETVLTGRVLSGEPERRRAFAAPSAPSPDEAWYSGRIWTDVLAGGNMAAHRGVFERIGTFDERLGPGTSHPAAEDNDLGFRALESGLRIRYLPSAVMFHRAWRGAGEYVALRWRYGVGKGGFYAKHASLSDRYMLTRMRRDVAKRLRRLPRYAVRHPAWSIGDLSYVAGIFLGSTSWLWRERLLRRS